MEREADVAALERLSARLFRGYAMRCAARAEVHEEEGVTDREWNLQGDDVFCRAIPDGTLAKVRQGSRWTLFLEWSKGYGRRLLTMGSREHVERYALDVAVHGPPGGPEFRGQGPDWRHVGDDDTLHAPALGGEFRLMPLFGGQYLLTFARNDFSLCVLDIGEPEELKCTAHERLQHFRGDALHLGLGSERIQLRGIAAAGVLGYVELFDGARLLLGHLAGQQFGLFFVRGETGECIGLYDFASLPRGDLRQILGWANHMRGDRGGEGDLSERGAWRGTEPNARARTPARQQPEQHARRTRLEADELRLVDRHLTWSELPTGPGATMVPKLLEGLRALARAGLPNQLLRGCDVRCLFRTQLGIEFHCCSKTLGRALAAVAAHSHILSPVGKRWSLRFGDLLLVDSELMRWIASVTPVDVVIPEVSAISTASGTPIGPTAAVTVLEPEVDSPVGCGVDAGEPRPPVEGAAPAVDTSDDGPPKFNEPSEFGDLENHERNEHARKRFNCRFRREGPLRVTLASVPLEQSASRWEPRRKVRDPP